jgi:prepilin-type N-terminal cleavage/methylation domain-containing protein
MAARTRRPAFTLVELLAVIAILALLAAVLLPSIAAFRGDTRHRAAADAIRGELAAARARAMEEGRQYRVAISQDGKRLRRAPDSAEFAQAAAADGPSGAAAAVEYEFEHVTAEVVAEQDVPVGAAEGWVTIASVQPDGTCREDTVLVAITEPNNGSLHLRVRGLTGSSRVVPNPAGGTK